MNKFLSLLVMSVCSAAVATAEADLVLFPVEPFNASGIANPDLPYSRFLCIPNLDVSGTGDLATVGDQLARSDWWMGLGESLPVAALAVRPDGGSGAAEEELLRLTGVLGGLVNVHSSRPTGYIARGEVFVSSPVFDRAFNPYDKEGGNGLVLSAAYLYKGSDLDRLLSSTSTAPLGGTGWIAANLYVVARAPYSSQFCILGAGYARPLTSEGDSRESSPYYDFSLTVEIPFLLGKNLPYLSLYGRLWSFQQSEWRVQAGMRFPGEAKDRELIIPFTEVIFGTYGNAATVGVKLNL